MKECDLCREDSIHYRVKSINYKSWIFVAKIVGRLFQKKANILMGGPGNRKLRTYKSLLRLIRWHIQEEQN